MTILGLEPDIFFYLLIDGAIALYIFSQLITFMIKRSRSNEHALPQK